MRANWDTITESQVGDIAADKYGTFDIASTLPAIAGILADTETTLLNNGLGVYTNTLFKPSTVSQVWDTTANRFDFSELTLGTRVDIRFDMMVTTTSGNQEISLGLELGSGVSQFDIPVVAGDLIKGLGAHRKIYNVFFYIGSDDVRASPGRITYISDALSSVLLNGFAIDVRMK